MQHDLILGTAGHIDHGKTSLIRALTGIDTDRLPEEKKRGITIELGYAHLELPPFRLGIVDVPGHEKFVRQMLSGATGMDLVLLVIACDDSINQQSREHLDILRLLNLSTGVIALTKSDLVDAPWAELVATEVRQWVQGTFLEHSEIVPVSAKTGAGLDELRDALRIAAQRVQSQRLDARLAEPFRMAIDRVFPIPGHGTVVTGSVSSGAVRVGDNLELQPSGIAVRVRGIQNHDSGIDQAHRGQRAAINLVGAHHDQVQRGDELAAVGHLQPTRLISAEVQMLPSLDAPLKTRSRIRFHLGTAELAGVIRWLDGDEKGPGERGWAQIYLNEPAVAVWGQPFVIRRESPMATLGGGRVLHPSAQPIKHPAAVDLDQLDRLAGTDELARVEAAIYFAPWARCDLQQLPRIAGVGRQTIDFGTLVSQGRVIEIAVSNQKTVWFHVDRMRELAELIVRDLERMHRLHPLRMSHRVSELVTRFPFVEQPLLIKQTLKYLQQQRRIQYSGDDVSVVGFGPKLTAAEKQLLEQLRLKLIAAQLAVPTVKELQQEFGKLKDSVVQLLKLLCESGDLVEVSADLYFSTMTLDSVKQQLRQAFQTQPEITASDIRVLLNSSRKYVIPLLEYLDQIGFTRRDGDLRRLVDDVTAAPQ